MPITKSAKKALRQSNRRNARNIVKKSALKSAVKGYNILVRDNKTDEAKSALPSVYKNVDKMCKTGLIKKGKANRMKSRLAKKSNKKVNVA
jgi:small subunit ribosomal protein S20